MDINPATFAVKALKGARYVYAQLLKPAYLKKPVSIDDPDRVACAISNRILDSRPLMVARFGSTELNAVVNYLGVHRSLRKQDYFGFVTGKVPAWWWEELKVSQLCSHSGFFPKKIQEVERFCALVLDDMRHLDVLGSWLPNEQYVSAELAGVLRVKMELLNPYFAKRPWTHVLADKKVLVVHPFSKTIVRQYSKRKLIYPNGILPEFDLKVVKAVQSIAGQKTPFADWFEALEHMKCLIDAEDYDIALIGAGAYGFHLAAHVKRSGKKAIHLGGALQLLFGIRGKRWENPNYHPIYNYSALMNEHWVKPDIMEKPANADMVEGGCYW